MAIKVNGTEVISNSRALNNIASVDATTTTSITAGGVGGSATSISHSTSEPTANIAVGSCYYDSTEGAKGTLYIYDGSEWGGKALG
jgi:hypothetical protein